MSQMEYGVDNYTSSVVEQVVSGDEEFIAGIV